MKRYYCTYFDRNYLVRAIALIESLNRYEQNDFELFAVCMDEISRTILKKLAFPNVTLIPIHQIEQGDEQLIAAKKDRSHIEYYWTTGPTIILRLLERNPEIDFLTYLDSDLCFFSSPDPIFDELGADSVLIHEHRFPPALKYLERHGKYNVGLLCFRNDRAGLEVLNWWRQRCIEWCRTVCSEDGKFADQAYLNDWPERFERVVVLKNVGAGVAPWNHTQYDYDVDESGRIFVHSTPLVFYHFHELKFVTPEIIVPFFNYPMSFEIIKVCYRPYVHTLSSAISVIRSVLPGYAFGLSGQVKLARHHKFLAKRSMHEYIKECQIPHVVTPFDDDWDWYCSDKPAAELGRVQAKPQFSATVNGDNSIRVLAGGAAQRHEAVCQINPEMSEDAGLTIATSIAPKEIEKQARAVESWVKLGFRPVSINCIEEINALRESFPQVEFVPAKRDAREVFGKPLIYFDDFLEYFRQGDFESGAIVNSDIFLAGDDGIIPFIESQARDSLVYGSRIDVDSRGILEGQVYEQGFDFFFFDRSLMPHIPRTDFCVGAPWWDYWAPLIAALEGFQIKRLVGPFAYHVRHRFRWDHKQWGSLAQKCFAYLIDKARENFYEDPDTNPWALLAKIFYINHNGDTRWSGRDDKMLPGVFFSSILEFLEKKSLRIGYAKDRPPMCRDVSEPVKKKRDILIHKTDSAMQCAAPRPPRQAPRAPGGGAVGPGGDEREKQCDLSIVLCTKDRAELLDEMLDSLEEAAAGVAYELIVVKGGSRDDTLDVLCKHGVEEVYSESEWLGPQRHSWPQLYNFGFSKARGKWAMYASDDIVFGPDAVTRALELLERQKEDVAGGIFFYRNLRPTRQDWAEYGIDFTDGARLLMNYGLVRLESFRRVGGFDEAYRFYCADTDLCHKLYEAGQQLIPLPGCFVTHNDLLDAQKQANADASGRDMELCRRRWSHFIRDDTAVPRRLLWRDDLSEAFDVPGDLEKTDSGPRPRGGIENFWRGLACFQQGMFGRAEQEFVQAVKSFCDHKQVLWWLAQAADKCHDKALAEKAAVGVVRLAPDFEPGLDLLVRVTGRQSPPRPTCPAGDGQPAGAWAGQCRDSQRRGRGPGDSAVPVLCSAQSGSVDTANSYACEPAFDMSCEEGSLSPESWKATDLTNQASPAAAMVRTPRRSGAVRSETELRRKLEKFSKIVVWGLKTGGHTHAHIHRHLFNTLKKLDAKVVLVDDLLENKDAIEGSDLVISVDVASRYLPIMQGVHYCLHNCEDDIHLRIDPSRNIRLRTYTRSAEQAGEKWDQVTFFDGKTRTLFQPWATDLLAGEFEEPILKPPSNIVFWVGSIWNDRLNRGNINEIEILKNVLAKRDIRFVHLQGISDLLNVRYVRHSLIAPAIAGRWQVENDYLPCRMWKNISYGQLGVSNVRKFDDVFNDCTVTGRSIEEIIDNTLSLPFGRYRDMICEQQEVVKSHHTYVNRLLNIIRAFESVENC